MTPETLRGLQSNFKCFVTWAREQDGAASEGVTAIEQLTPDLFLAYQQELTFRLNRVGRPITIATQVKHLAALRQWGRYLVEQDFLMSNPARWIKLPRVPKSLPRVIPNVKEAVRLVECRTGWNGYGDSDNRASFLIYRNRAILELLYSTGLRRGEVAHLRACDLDLVGGYVWVRQGKGRKDRVVPLGQMAITALTIYLDAVRPSMYKGEKADFLFLNKWGSGLSGAGIYQMVKQAVVKAKLSRKITTHSLRHAAATHMLQNGAPIRHLQEFLGHASMETTQVYTRVTITDLKATHAKYHPREAMNNE